MVVEVVVVLSVATRNVVITGSGSTDTRFKVGLVYRLHHQFRLVLVLE